MSPPRQAGIDRRRPRYVAAFPCGCERAFWSLRGAKRELRCPVHDLPRTAPVRRELVGREAAPPPAITTNAADPELVRDILPRVLARLERP